MNSNLAFLQSEWPDVREAAIRAEAAAYPDPLGSMLFITAVIRMQINEPVGRGSEDLSLIEDHASINEMGFGIYFHPVPQRTGMLPQPN